MVLGEVGYAVRPGVYVPKWALEQTDFADWLRCHGMYRVTGMSLLYYRKAFFLGITFSVALHDLHRAKYRPKYVCLHYLGRDF